MLSECLTECHEGQGRIISRLVIIFFPLVPQRKDDHGLRMFNLKLVHNQHNNPKLLRINRSCYWVQWQSCPGMIPVCCSCMEWLGCVR
jgi:hypothetical protein